MKYHLVEDRRNVHFTYGLIRHLCDYYGHSLMARPEDADMILVSLCDVTLFPDLAKIRSQHPRAKIAVGGHFAFFFKACALFADYVCVGQGFEFFACQSEEEIRSLPCVYYHGRDTKANPIVANQKILWRLCPVIQVSTKSFYYFAGVGCKNKCRFCFTSWTHRHELNNPALVRNAGKMIGSKGNLTLISNEYADDFGIGNNKVRVRDVMLRDFLKERRKTVQLVRVGLEFATEASRRRLGKPFSDDELFEAIRHAGRLGVGLQLFCIGGIDTHDEWADLFSRVPEDYRFSPRVFFKFTNLEYQMFTPLFAERHKIDPGRYLTARCRDRFFREAGSKNKRVRMFPVASPALSFWRMGISLSTTLEQFNLFYKLRNERDPARMFGALMRTHALDTDYRDEVILPYKLPTEARRSDAEEEAPERDQ